MKWIAEGLWAEANMKQWMWVKSQVTEMVTEAEVRQGSPWIIHLQISADIHPFPQHPKSGEVTVVTYLWCGLGTLKSAYLPRPHDCLPRKMVQSLLSVFYPSSEDTWQAYNECLCICALAVSCHSPPSQVPWERLIIHGWFLHGWLDTSGWIQGEPWSKRTISKIPPRWRTIAT